MNRELLNEVLGELIGRQPAAEWIERLEAAGVPCAPLQTIGQVMEHPQTVAMGMMQEVPGSPMRLIGLPLSFDGVRPPVTAAPPRLGQHSDLILKGDRA